MVMFLAGGGNPQDEARVWAAAFDGVATAVYWPFALPDDQVPSAEAWLMRGLRSLSIEANVATWASLDGHHAQELDDFDLVFVGGGTTSKLVEHARRHGFDTALANHIRGGGRYYGGSAGALLMCEWITLASMIEDDSEAAGMRGIGAFVGASVLPHADTFAPDTAPKLAAQLGHKVFALPEASGVRVCGGASIPSGQGSFGSLTPTARSRPWESSSLAAGEAWKRVPIRHAVAPAHRQIRSFSDAQRRRFDATVESCEKRFNVPEPAVRAF